MPRSIDTDLLQHVVELMSSLGEIETRRMFGGVGIFRLGRMFALIYGGELYLKVDDESLPHFAARKLPALTYESRGRQVVLGYRLAPPEALDNPQTMREWAGEAWACALRAGSSAPAKRPSRQL